MLKIARYLILVYLIVVLFGCSHFQGSASDVLFQTSTFNALLEGVYDGETKFHDLKQHGNFGIGTLDSLDGEMIGFDGNFYQIKSNGVVYPVNDSMKTPFAVVTSFESDKTLSLDKPMDYNQLMQYLDSLLPTKSIFYAIKIEGKGKYIKTRSVPKQNKPYPRLVEVVKNQPTFEFSDIEGTIVGFWCPKYVQGINVPGYHFHFITKDKKSGGHLLECQLENAKIEIDYTSKFFMILPESEEFQKANLTNDTKVELERIEK